MTVTTNTLAAFAKSGGPGRAQRDAAVSKPAAHAPPHHLPYFNGLTGKPRAAPDVASASNVDRGQATGALADDVRAHRIPEVAFANCNGYAEAAAIGPPYVPADPGNRDDTGYLAIPRTAMVDDECAGGAKWGWVVDARLPIAVIAGAINLYCLP